MILGPNYCIFASRARKLRSEKIEEIEAREVLWEEMHLLGSSLLSPQNKNNKHALPRSGIVHDLNVISLYCAI